MIDTGARLRDCNERPVPQMIRDRGGGVENTLTVDIVELKVRYRVWHPGSSDVNERSVGFVMPSLQAE
jgi:hypothetical protein